MKLKEAWAYLKMEGAAKVRLIDDFRNDDYVANIIICTRPLRIIFIEMPSMQNAYYKLNANEA
ncbi:hypothetical protein HW555_007387 [Spodoptera exigua]|uniref:Uncharacterized protein n=1 Tax=Spodoptera exigua TaxID=7107 RepID=A0A835L2Q4_SPOEX|nr:hypothetical protein HW555_007387 [Spodoptera exigua]